MGNEITRLAAVKAFSLIAASPMHLDLSCVLEHVMADLTAFLRKDDQALRDATIKTLDTLVKGYGATPQVLKMTPGRPQKKRSNKNDMVEENVAVKEQRCVRNSSNSANGPGELRRSARVRTPNPKYQS
ncbi:cullin-associated NEDD8-dissociated protein 1-like [Apium graveolens]|uniref:cullin-associated NEDD8-dissociated protein 1-like n=1 Tax=Apium graveolens TaxID=4045 RepID=UPI003D7B87AF